MAACVHGISPLGACKVCSPGALWVLVCVLLILMAVAELVTKET